MHPHPVDDLGAATSLRLHRRLARAQEPRPCGLGRGDVERLAEAAQGAIPRRPGWVGRLVEAREGEARRRAAVAAAPDAPLLVADRRDRFVAFLVDWPQGRPPAEAGDDWNLAIALGHLALHWPTLEPDGDPEAGEGPLLYVPHLIARTAPNHGARLEAIWWAAALLMPAAAFPAIWEASGRDPARAAELTSAAVPPGIAEARAAALGLPSRSG